MPTKLTLRKCIKLYGSEVGDKYFKAVKKLSDLGLNVASGWDEKEVSLSVGEHTRGRTFKFINDYESIVMHDGIVKNIKTLQYRDISQKYFLPAKSLYDGYRHDFVDKNL